MAKYSELQTRKLISSYGGVGSIIETTYGALLIKDFDKWRYFFQIRKNKISLEDGDFLNDERLLDRLKYYFPEVKDLIKVPANFSNSNSNLPLSRDHIINAEYFPKWMYCNRCGRFKHLSDWFKGWKGVYRGAKAQDAFHPPKCYSCYAKAVKEKSKRKFYELEQVRFIMTAPNGKIRELPWQQWTNLSRLSKEEGIDEEGSVRFNGKCCDKQDLRYIKSDKLVDFSGIKVVCKNSDCETNGKPVTLFGLFGVKLQDFDKEGNPKLAKDKDDNLILSKNGKPQKILFKPVIRTSNSVYYPLITNSLYLPSKTISNEIKKKINTLFFDAESPIEKIQNILKDKYKSNLSENEIQKILHPDQSIFISEIEYRLKEYLFLTKKDNANFENDSDLIIEQVTQQDQLNKIGIANLLKLRRLKMSSVQTGYTRQEPIDKDLFAEVSMDNYIETSKHVIKAKYTSSNGKYTKRLPGIESYGEGIFIEFDEEKIKKWSTDYLKSDSCQKRLTILQENARTMEYGLSEEKRKMISIPEYLAKFILIHTFSHLLIKELEFLVGYPATSISERLYIDENHMQGVLIYTIAGSEGSYGGLVSQASPERFLRIVESALIRAKDCASDPICYHSDGQGVGGLNLAACYSCCLLPETSCEEFNSYLDRSILIEDKFGFLNEV